MVTCGRGWGQRCPHSEGRKCRCRCQGENHGTVRRLHDKEKVAPVPLGELTQLRHNFLSASGE